MKRTLEEVSTRRLKHKLTEAEKREKWMKDVKFNALRAEQTNHFQLIGSCATPEEFEHLLMCAELEGAIVNHIFKKAEAEAEAEEEKEARQLVGPTMGEELQITYAARELANVLRKGNSLSQASRGNH